VMDGLNFAMITGATGICMKIARGRFFRAILSRRSLSPSLSPTSLSLSLPLSLSLSSSSSRSSRASRACRPSALLHPSGAHRRHRSRINASPPPPIFLPFVARILAMENRIALVLRGREELRQCLMTWINSSVSGLLRWAIARLK